MQKLLTLSTALLLMLNVSYAQLHNRLLSPNPFAESLSKVIENYQNNYLHIQGQPLTPDEDRDIYQSTIALPGASQCLIYRFHSTEDTTASWQAILYSGEDFKEASKVYRNSYKHLKQTKFKVGITNNGFEGQMENPSEDLRFTSSILRPATYTETYKNFMAEIEMINSIDGWVVQLNLHSRKEDTER
jgi:hypothetical protein